MRSIITTSAPKMQQLAMAEARESAASKEAARAELQKMEATAKNQKDVRSLGADAAAAEFRAKEAEARMCVLYDKFAGKKEEKAEAAAGSWGDRAASDGYLLESPLGPKVRNLFGQGLHRFQLIDKCISHHARLVQVRRHQRCCGEAKTATPM